MNLVLNNLSVIKPFSKATKIIPTNVVIKLKNCSHQGKLFSSLMPPKISPNPPSNKTAVP
ncbi:hypothetical protein [Okeania sp. KiyG1]|uniref:hypothetical protein n=1 Tax=Okeania sp. KiyG1 TaxID=2720165 RepID=UPI0019230B04|nr:hypothetical protein [Okeania sp. KiyG1]